MDRRLYAEMISNLNMHDEAGQLKKCAIFVFGHCEASLCLIDELFLRDYKVTGILDNSSEKQGIIYRDIPVMFPDGIMDYNSQNTIVLLATRFYEQMNRQLRDMGFLGSVIKLVDYNTYSEYSLSADTIDRKRQRLEHGMAVLDDLRKRYYDALIVFCPFNALGDLYLCMSYLPALLVKKGITSFAVCVPTEGCAEVCGLFGVANIAVLEQNDLDAAVQAVIYRQDESCFIAHQDRPYVVNLHKALHIAKIPLEDIYKIGVFGLSPETIPVMPLCWEDYSGLEEIVADRSAIISPYAKSVTALPEGSWDRIVEELLTRGYKVYTNVIGDEKALPGTTAISPDIRQFRSVVEKAGLFIGVRSGLCDVLRSAECRKIALYPDYYYSDTKWKAIDMYELPEFENIIAGEDLWITSLFRQEAKEPASNI